MGGTVKSSSCMILYIFSVDQEATFQREAQAEAARHAKLGEHSSLLFVSNIFSVDQEATFQRGADQEARKRHFSHLLTIRKFLFISSQFVYILGRKREWQICNANTRQG